MRARMSSAVMVAAGSAAAGCTFSCSIAGAPQPATINAAKTVFKTLIISDCPPVVLELANPAFLNCVPAAMRTSAGPVSFLT